MKPGIVTDIGRYAIEHGDSTDGTDGKESIYSLVGYATAYRLFYLPPLDNFTPSPDVAAISQPLPPTNTDPTDLLPSRQRISQFLILPPHHHRSHGSTLYTTILTFLHATAGTTEITVEDPSEAFDNLRDINDLLRLRKDPSFASLKLDTSTRIVSRTTALPTSSLLPTTLLTSLRQTHKLEPRQWSRMLEAHLLSTIPPSHRNVSRLTRKDKSANEHDRAYYFWRLLVKQRLWRHNRDALALVEREERVERIEGTVAGVEEGYVRLLEWVVAREKAGNEKGATLDGAGTSDGKRKGDGESGSAKVGRKRRRVVVEEEEEDDEVDDEDDKQGADDDDGDGEEEDEAENGKSVKRPRTDLTRNGNG
ncbi:hypothetical protein MRB53_037932 [Persea americana]|nr:hypothetical protein MRB53_037932 [Persea americana]